jgi:hypothetical protein
MMRTVAVRAGCLVLALSLAGCADERAEPAPVALSPEVEQTDEAAGGGETPRGGEAAGGEEAAGGDAEPHGDDATAPAVVQRWTAVADAPLALTEVAAAPFGGAVWTAGGFLADGQATSAVLVYDPTFDVWEEGPPLPSPLHHAAMVSTGDRLFVLGGYAGSGFDLPTDEVLVLDVAAGRWEVAPPLPAPRAAGAAAWDGTRVVYGGGVGPEGLADEVYALDGDGWEPVGALSEPREHLAGASDGQGNVWFLAGRTGGFDTNLGTVDLADASGVVRLGDLPTPRGGVAGLHLSEIGACALGGEGTHGTFDEVECIDAEGTTTVLPALQHARHGLGAAVVEDRAYAVLGGPEPGLFVSAVVEALEVGSAR